jgi:hypothetical protein
VVFRIVSPSILMGDTDVSEEHAYSMFRIEGEGSMLFTLFQNVGTRPLDYNVPQSRRSQAEQSRPWKPQNLHIQSVHFSG